MEIAFLIISIFALICLYSIAVGVGLIADVLIDIEAVKKSENVKKSLQIK